MLYNLGTSRGQLEFIFSVYWSWAYLQLRPPTQKKLFQIYSFDLFIISKVVLCNKKYQGHIRQQVPILTQILKMYSNLVHSSSKRPAEYHTCLPIVIHPLKFSPTLLPLGGNLQTINIIHFTQIRKFHFYENGFRRKITHSFNF